MKKVKVTLKPSSPGKKLYLFPSSEALYVWLCAAERKEQVEVPGIEELVLEPGGFIEAELRGFDYAYEGGQRFRRLDYVRLGKATHPRNAAGFLVTVHQGWVSGGLLPMKDCSDIDMDVRLLSADDPGRLDLAALFKDPPPPPGPPDDDNEDTGDPPPSSEDIDELLGLVDDDDDDEA
jgi:hypothetical protein